MAERSDATSMASTVGVMRTPPIARPSDIVHHDGMVPGREPKGEQRREPGPRPPQHLHAQIP
jgi:hypothetical protein